MPRQLFISSNMFWPRSLISGRPLLLFVSRSASPKDSFQRWRRSKQAALSVECLLFRECLLGGGERAKIAKSLMHLQGLRLLVQEQSRLELELWLIYVVVFLIWENTKLASCTAVCVIVVLSLISRAGHGRRSGLCAEESLMAGLSRPWLCFAIVSV